MKPETETKMWAARLEARLALALFDEGAKDHREVFNLRRSLCATVAKLESVETALALEAEAERGKGER